VWQYGVPAEKTGDTGEAAESTTRRNQTILMQHIMHSKPCTAGCCCLLLQAGANKPKAAAAGAAATSCMQARQHTYSGKLSRHSWGKSSMPFRKQELAL
jgi:hypothetical protein